MRKAFTLIEVLIVAIILAVLASVMVVAIQKSQQKNVMPAPQSYHPEK